MARRKTKWIAAGAVAVALIGGGAAIAVATGSDDTPLRGSDLERATAAALEHTGGGTVVETEIGDEGAAYGVEVRLDDGTVVEVNLNESFEVIGEETDDEGPGDQDGPGDD